MGTQPSLSIAILVALMVGMAASPAGAVNEALDAERELTLLLTSGLGGQLVDPEGRTVASVAATLRTEAERARSEGRSVLILDVGRTVTPYAESRHEGGETMLAMLAAAGCGAYAPDPMDLSLGVEQIRRLGDRGEVPILLPQLAAESEAGPGLIPSVAFDLGEGLTVRIRNLFATGYLGDLHAAGVATGETRIPETLGSDEEVDVVVIHSSGTGRDTITRKLTWSLLDDPRGADLFLDPDMGHDMDVRSDTEQGRVFLSGRERESGPWRLARLDARVERRSGRWRLAQLESRVVPLDAEAEIDTDLADRARAAWDRFHRENDRPLLAGGPTSYEELRRFALEAMREETRAEVALLNRGALRPVAEKFFAGETLTTEAVLRMLSIDQQLEVIDLTGAQLVSLANAGAKRVRMDGSPRLDSLEFLGMTFDLSGAGTPQATVSQVEVNGRPIVRTDLYRVVTNRYLLAGGDAYPEITDREGELGDETYVELRDDVVLPRLERAEEPFVDLRQRSLWRYGFDEIALLADGVQTDRSDLYEQSSDSRARASDSASITGRVDFRIDLDRTRWRWENRFNASFGLLEVDDRTREVDDDIRLDSAVVFPRARVLGGNPFVAVLLDSEIRPNRDDSGVRRDRQFEQTLSAGISWETLYWPRIRLGAMARNYSNTDRDPQLGLSAAAEFFWPALGRRPGLDARLLAEHLEVDESQVERLDLEIRLLFPVVQNLMFTPAVNYYLFDDSDFPGSATYYRLSLGLAYRWSSKHQSWGRAPR